jgi:hypothetical protein
VAEVLSGPNWTPTPYYTKRKIIQVHNYDVYIEDYGIYLFRDIVYSLIRDYKSAFLNPLNKG